MYDFAGYMKLWWDFLNVDDRKETHYTNLKFSTLKFQRNQQCKWFKEWWQDYRVNRTAIDPMYHTEYCRKHCNDHFEQNIVESFHSIYKTVKEMTDKEWDPFHVVNYSLQEYMREHLEWLVLTKIKHQIVLAKPMTVRRIYTKAWDGLLYKRNRFP